jgi:hypothetical protein
MVRGKNNWQRINNQIQRPPAKSRGKTGASKTTAVGFDNLARIETKKQKTLK